jgi:hypothetical protein
MVVALDVTECGAVWLRQQRRFGNDRVHRLAVVEAEGDVGNERLGVVVGLRDRARSAVDQ